MGGKFFDWLGLEDTCHFFLNPLAATQCSERECRKYSGAMCPGGGGNGFSEQLARKYNFFVLL